MTSDKNNDRDTDSLAPLKAQGFTPAEGGSEAPLSAALFEPLDSRNVTGPKRQYWPMIAAGTAAIVIISMLFFLLTARSVAIEIAVIGSSKIDIQGINLPLGSRYLMRPGEYTVSITADGYLPYNGQIIVTDADNQRFDIAPQILPGDVSINSQPSGATVFVNDVAVGITPLTGQMIDAGEQQLTLQLSRYQPVTQTIDITGRSIRQSVDVVMPPDWAVITVITQPYNAALLLNDEAVDLRFVSTDLSPEPSIGQQRIEILSGETELTIGAPGFVSTKRSLTVVAGYNQDLGTIKLIPADGILTLDSQPGGANVTVDGKFLGRTPLTLSLSPDREHLVQLAKPGYRRKSQRINLAQGISESLSLSLSPELGDVAFNITPADAQLVVNGEVVGIGSQQLALPAFEHRIEVRKSGYASQRSRVQPRPGLEQVIDIALLTESEARKASMTPEITNALGQTLVLIDPSAEPINEFEMGASRREPGRRANEVLHAVRLERAYYLASTETSNAQFRQFLSTHNSGQIEGNSLNREHQPVAQVSWQQAATFCNWLSLKEGLPVFYRENQGIVVGYNPSSTGYRLPTEAEWAYASRVDGKTFYRFAWGDEFPPSKPVTNVADNTSAFVTGRILNGYSDGHIVSAPVASFPANHRGLFDIGGNVAEWVHDVYQIPSANAQVEVDPLGPQSGDNYTVRGASWGLSRLSELRLTYRDYGQRGRDDLGFRIARYAE
ncbi:SUMF1/EgtB/PvdO family nonheme iron enzyme [Flavobacteriaceae bacterium]|nr:SUMF1/EgtB/PvdO family nonheme iron enzyme [Flavobacteriaceae bacterium]